MERHTETLENDRIYRPVRDGDPEIAKLAESIEADGLLESLVVTRDHWIVSGHRRHAACRIAGLRAVECRVLDVRRTDLSEWRKNGKGRLTIIACTDYDPDGIEMPHSIGNSLRDDLGADMDHVNILRCGVDPMQVAALENPPEPLEAKESSARYGSFLERTGGTTAFEIEAVPPADLEWIMMEGIDSCIDVEAFNREREREQQDAVRLQALKRVAQERLIGLTGEVGGYLV